MRRPTVAQHCAWRKSFEICDGLSDLDAAMACFARDLIQSNYIGYLVEEGDEDDPDWEETWGVPHA